jgi:flagellar hook capping protein FlgD
MRPPRNSPWFWILLLAATISGCDDEQEPAALVGRVLDAADQPIPGARVGIVYQLTGPALAGAHEPVPIPGPRATKLYPSAPNPFEHRTAIRFDLAHECQAQLRIFEFQGRPVRDLIPERALPAGAHIVVWDGMDGSGGSLPNGLYVVRLTVVSPDSSAGEWKTRILENDPDPNRLLQSFVAVTGADGRFRIVFPQLPIHEPIDAIDVDGGPLGRYTVLSRIQVCAVWGTPEAPLTACANVDLGDLNRSVSADLHQPVP